ncbi:MAG: LURP-one-related family protein [Planctomycetes bacterium]|nr:LURP-one-related family protein [Planctomycetota bacterium]
MRYVMKQKWLAFGEDFTVQDAEGEARYFVDGRAFSIGDKLSFQDLRGNELVYIRQRLLAWGPTYEILRDGDVLALVKKELFTLFKCRFDIDVPGPRDIEAVGDFLDHEYAFEREGQTIARVSKRWFAWTDTYGIDIARGVDDVLLLASAVVIDMACHDRSR